VTAPRPVRVLVVDDSMFMRAAIKRIFEADPRTVVAGVAKDGLDAIEQVRAHRPDVVTMDFNMPRMDGAAAVREIMRTCPTPVVMLSAHTREGARETFEALAAGAVDFLAKPSGEVSADFQTIGALLVAKALAAAGAVPRALAPARPPAPRPELPMTTWPPTGPRVVIVGVSTGGPSALSRVIPALPGDVPFALVVVQHMPAAFTATLAERLNALSAIEVREAVDGDRPRQGLALIAPGDRHLEVEGSGVLRLRDGPEVHGCRPSVDVTMKSAAGVFGRRLVGVVMTGMGKDGAEGMTAIKAAGGRTLAQSQETCVIYGMPRAAVEAGAVDEVIALDDLAARLQRL
jgi:two-component system, chemotaxis family, protein-glutamate methylesterase/glutaminase